MGSGDDLVATAERTLEVVCGVARVDFGGVLRLDEAAQTLTLIAHRGLSPEDVEPLRVRRLDASHVGEAARTGRAIVTDLTRSRVLSPEVRERVKVAGFRTQLALPIPVSGRTWGVMALISRERRTFDGDEIRLLQAVAHQVGSAVGRAALLAETRAKSRRLETLARLARTLTATLSIGEVLRRVADAAVELFDSSIARVWLVDDDDAHVSLRASAGSQTSVEGVTRLRIGEGLAGTVVATRSPLTIPDVFGDPRTRNVARIRAEGTVSAALVPVVLGDRVLGALSIGVRQRYEYTPEEMSVLGSLALHAANAIHNARLFEDERARRAYLAALLEINTKIGAVTETEPLLASIAEEAARLLGVDNAGFRLVDGDELVLAGLAGNAAQTMLRPRIRIGQSLSGRVVAEGRTLLCEIASAPDVIPEHFAADQRLGYTTFLGVPLTVGDRTIGVLTFRARQPFTARDRELAEAFAGQAAIALEQSRLRRETGRQAARMAALADLGRLLSETLDFDRVAQRVADSVCTLLGARSSCLYRVDPESGGLVAVTASTDAGEVFAWTPVLAPGTGLAGLAVRERRPAASADVLADPRIVYTDEVRVKIAGQTHRALVAIPLLVQERLFGALAVSDDVGRRFADEEVRLAQAFADQAALALENARLYTESTRRRLEAEELARLARTLTESLDVRAVGDRIVESVLALFRAHSSALRLLRSDGSLTTLALGGPVRDLLAPSHVLLPGVGVAGRAVTEGRPVTSPAVLSDARIVLTEDLRRGIVEAGIGAVLAVPLRVKGRIIGALSISDRTGRVFAEAEARLLQAFADQAALALENARLFSLETARREQLATLADIERELAAELDPARLLSMIVERVTRLFDANGVIYLVEDGRVLVPRAWTGREALGDLVVPFGQGVVGTAAELRQGLIVNDYPSSLLALPPWLEAGVRRVVAQPLMIHDRLLGVIAMNRVGEAAAPFLAEDLAVLESFAARAAIALENARLYQEAQERLRETTTLMNVGQILSRPGPAGERMRQVAKEVARAFGADMVGAYFLDATKEALVPLGGYHVPRDLLARFMARPMMLGRTPELLPAWREGRAVWSPDPLNDPRFDREWMGVLPPLSVLLASATARGEPIGALFVVWWGTGRQFQPSEIRLMESVAAQVGLAMENAELARQTEIKLRETETLLSVSQAMSTTLDLQALLRHFLRRVTRAVDADSAGVWMLGDDGASLEPRAGYHVPREFLEHLRGVRISLVAHPFCAEAVRTKRPVFSKDVAGDARIPDFAKHPFRHQSQLFVPIIAKERVIGGLSLIWWERAHEFTDNERALMEAIANQAGVAIENARLFEERTRAYRELAAAQDQLVRTEKLRALGEMASGVAHDFNNLLASILGRAQLTLQRVQNPQLRQWLEVIERAALDGAQTVRRLQEFTRIRRDQPFVAVDLNAVVRDALEITQSRWREEPVSRGVALEVRTSFAELPRVAGDPAELREAMTNLILNALDAMPGGGVLALTTAVADGAVVVTVADTGVGIPEAIRDRIFDPFFTTKGPQGTGLGLSMTYGILERHGARVAVESAEGRGTTFRLTFAPGAPEEAAEAAPAAGPPSGGAALRCLVVDDEPVVGAMLGDVLASGGHRAVVVEDGGEAIARFSAEPFDVVFTDLAMPRVSGWQVARAIKAIAPTVPVVLVTGFGVELSPEERRAHGVDLALVKPLKIQEILDAAAQAARRRAQPIRTEDE